MISYHSLRKDMMGKILQYLRPRLGDILGSNSMVVNKLTDLIVEELCPFLHGGLGTEIHQKPEPPLESTNLVFGPALLPGQARNTELDCKFVIVVSKEFFFALSSFVGIHIGKNVLSQILWSTSKTLYLCLID